MALLLSLIDGFKKDLGQGGLICILAIVLVFAILSIIIAITFGTGKMIDKFAVETQAKPEPKQNTPVNTSNKIDVDMTDEDAIVATLVASIDFRQQTKKDIKVVSIKEIK